MICTPKSMERASGLRHHYDVFALPFVPRLKSPKQLEIRPFTAAYYNIKERECLNNVRRQNRIRCSRAAHTAASSTLSFAKCTHETDSDEIPSLGSMSPPSSEGAEAGCEMDIPVHTLRVSAQSTTGAQHALPTSAAHSQEWCLPNLQRDLVIETRTHKTCSIVCPAGETAPLAMDVSNEPLQPSSHNDDSQQPPNLRSSIEDALWSQNTSTESGSSQTSDVPRVWTLAEYENLVHLRDQAQLDWEDILSYFPGATLQSVKMHYSEHPQSKRHQLRSSSRGMSEDVTSPAQMFGPKGVHKTRVKHCVSGRRRKKASVDLPREATVERSAIAVEPSRNSRSGRAIRHPFRNRPQEGYL